MDESVRSNRGHVWGVKCLVVIQMSVLDNENWCIYGLYSLYSSGGDVTLAKIITMMDVLWLWFGMSTRSSDRNESLARVYRTMIFMYPRMLFSWTLRSGMVMTWCMQ